MKLNILSVLQKLLILGYGSGRHAHDLSKPETKWSAPELIPSLQFGKIVH